MKAMRAGYARPTKPYDPAKHPRDANGRFAHKGGLTSSMQVKQPRQKFKLDGTPPKPRATFGSNAGTTPFMFDMKKGDLPGQTSLLDRVRMMKVGGESQRRAKAGGETGPNGQFYPPGSFIDTRGEAKSGRKTKRGSGDGQTPIVKPKKSAGKTPEQRARKLLDRINQRYKRDDPRAITLQYKSGVTPKQRDVLDRRSFALGEIRDRQQQLKIHVRQNPLDAAAPLMRLPKFGRRAAVESARSESMTAMAAAARAGGEKAQGRGTEDRMTRARQIREARAREHWGTADSLRTKNRPLGYERV
jgi:hypothetical protein